MDYALFFASKLGRWLASICFVVLCFGGTYWLGGHNREKAIEAKYAAAITKSNAALDKELELAGRENSREFGLRQILRSGNKNFFNEALIVYAGTPHENKDSNCRSGISDDGVQLINASIEASAGAGRAARAGGVRTP